MAKQIEVRARLFIDGVEVEPTTVDIDRQLPPYSPDDVRTRVFDRIRRNRARGQMWNLRNGEPMTTKRDELIDAFRSDDHEHDRAGLMIMADRVLKDWRRSTGATVGMASDNFGGWADVTGNATASITSEMNTMVGWLRKTWAVSVPVACAWALVSEVEDVQGIDVGPCPACAWARDTTRREHCMADASDVEVALACVRRAPTPIGGRSGQLANPGLWLVEHLTTHRGWLLLKDARDLANRWARSDRLDRQLYEGVDLHGNRVDLRGRAINDRIDEHGNVVDLSGKPIRPTRDRPYVFRAPCCHGTGRRIASLGDLVLEPELHGEALVWADKLQAAGDPMGEWITKVVGMWPRGDLRGLDATIAVLSRLTAEREERFQRQLGRSRDPDDGRALE